LSYGRKGVGGKAPAPFRASPPFAVSVSSTSLYIHVPFCAGLCDYCDFFSVSTSTNGENSADAMDAFVGAVLEDAEDQLACFEVENVPTVYIGGGTPSVLGAARIECLLAGLKGLLAHLRGQPAEVTIEANPESVDKDFVLACVAGGANRISLGVQTFHEEARGQIGRVGGLAQIEHGLSLAAQFFPGAFSADLIAGLPFQTSAVLLSDIARLLEFRPAHVSLYSLTIDAETVLEKRVSDKGRAALFLPTEDEADDLWLAGRDMLEQAGLEQYEVSNFALPGKTCAHNIRYWLMESWLGIGPAASGTVIGANATGWRFTYPWDIASYLAAPRPRIRFAQTEKLRVADLMRESLLMGFRYRGGPDAQTFKARFGHDISSTIPETIARWRQKGFFETELAPSKEGLLFVNSFLRDAFAEMDCAGGE